MTTTTERLAPPEWLAAEDRALWDAMGEAVPRFTDWPTPGAPHELHANRAVARMLGTPLTPAQQWTLRVATERRIDDPRRYRWPVFLTTKPRQVGKTTEVRVCLLTRAILYDGRRAFYTAQTGKDAAKRFGELASAITKPGHPLAPLVAHRKAAGSSEVRVLPTDSTIAPFAPTPASLHGYTPHDVALDELFAFDLDGGNALLGAVIPAQQTLVDRQLIELSTAGDRTSTFLRAEVEAGRATAGTDDGPGYVEWSMHPSADPYDPEAWRFHPGLGYTVTLDDLAEAAAKLPPGEWIRAYCNRWTDDADPLFDMARYDALVGQLDPVPLSECSVGFGTHPDRSRVAAVAAWRVGDRIAVKVLHASADVAGWPNYLAELQLGDPRPGKLVGDDGGLNRRIIDELQRLLPRHRQPTVTNPREWQLASAGLHSAIDDGRLLHDGDPVLRGAVEGALSRPMGESWALSHKSPPEVVALAAALRGLDVKRDTLRPVLI